MFFNLDLRVFIHCFFETFPVSAIIPARDNHRTPAIFGYPTTAG